MNTDFVIRLEKRKKYLKLWPYRAIAVAEPPSRRGTVVGELTDAPADVWGPASGYATGNIDVAKTAAWLSGCVGNPILKAIAEEYPFSLPVADPERADHMRLVITAIDDLQVDMMKIPWEIVESFNYSQGLPYSERLSVVRILRPNQKEFPEPAGEKLRIGVLWANPRNDITGLTEHLDELVKIGRDHENELSILQPLEFGDPDEILTSFVNQRPHVVYHIGHAEQRADQKVHLVIGTAGAAKEYDVEKFRALLQQIGPPRVLLLNSCAAGIGYQLNPYLGAALSCAQQIDAVIAMQTMVPQRAAMLFAKAFLRALANGKGMVECVKQGRFAIQRGEEFRLDAPPTFKPYIPVLLQKTIEDMPLTVDIAGRELKVLLNKIRQYIVRVYPYRRRTHDPALRKLIELPSTQRRVSVVSGPSGSGKSTSIGRIILELVDGTRYRAGERYLYYEVPENMLSASDRDIETQINLLFLSVADRFSSQTGRLAKQLKDSLRKTPEDAIPLVATWLEEEERVGNKYFVCIDAIPAALAQEIAKRAASTINNGGHLLLVGNQIDVADSLPVNKLAITLMTEDEIQQSAVDANLPASREEIRMINRYSGGFPYFVDAWIRRAFSPREEWEPDKLAELFLESQELSGEQENILCFAALCDVPVPKAILARSNNIEALEPLVIAHLLLAVGDDSYQIPEALRPYLKTLIGDEEKSRLHETAFREFSDQAEPDEDLFEDNRFQLVSRWYREAFRHALSAAQLAKRVEVEKSVEFLDSAETIAEILHDRYLEKQDQLAEATSLWEQYRSAAFSLERYDNRDSDIRYADCLIKLGEYDQAEEILEPIANGDEDDSTRFTAIFLYSNLIKERGRTGEFSLRIELLQRALNLAGRLKQADVDHKWLQEQTASLEHSLGNALSYGKEAKLDEASQHLESARALFEEIGSPMQARTISEQIELKRYNEILNLEERRRAIQTLLELRQRLVTRDMRYDAILISYELGRLESDSSKSATHYQWAAEKAGNSYQPLNWHAAIHALRQQVSAGQKLFSEVAPELEQYALQVSRWQSRGWSRRVWRDTLLYLGENYLKTGEQQQAMQAIRTSWQAVKTVSKFGEGRNDRRIRDKVGFLYGRLALRADQIDDARKVAEELTKENDPSGNPMYIDKAALTEFFSQEIEGRTYE